ncbi:hypothetical protein BBAD15_g8533 [Beauveria bassiana D1-5]|uniref:SWIM-type domain-containing protein n=1 Tax=Beauveria bassiana D1-5 TaxID=1245745 RepID=A0A0A2VF21_BEABA|nr:hypothetical protein BBAD15_g8533 [Beauveria bassiana D1-5]
MSPIYASIQPPKRDTITNLVHTPIHTHTHTHFPRSPTMSSSRSRAPRRHKRELSDSSVQIIEIRIVNKRPRTEERPAKPPPPREEQRLHDFEDSPPHRFNRTFQRATAGRFFVLSRERCDEGDCPQEEFELAGSTGNVYTIRIGRELWCDCEHSIRGNVCRHLVYILHRVLKAPFHFLYQRALLSSELRQIYDNLSRGNAAENRKAVEGECAICYNDFESGEDAQSRAVVWCRAGCGQNLHKTCFDRSTWEAGDEDEDEGESWSNYWEETRYNLERNSRRFRRR